MTDKINNINNNNGGRSRFIVYHIYTLLVFTGVKLDPENK